LKFYKNKTGNKNKTNYPHSSKILNKTGLLFSSNGVINDVFNDLNGLARWFPDPLVKKCKLCPTKFGIFNRKHHCRFCGDIFCKKCSDNFGKIEPYYKSDVRMCNNCYILKTK
jgi:hypothetical protein